VGVGCWKLFTIRCGGFAEAHLKLATKVVVAEHLAGIPMTTKYKKKRASKVRMRYGKKCKLKRIC